jgi:hypothetical protein
VPTRWTGLAGVVRRNRNEHPATPVELVVQLSPPSLIEDGLVPPRLLRYVPPRFLDIAFNRLGHIANMQILDCHHSVVLADGCRGLVQEVASGIADGARGCWNGLFYFTLGLDAGVPTQSVRLFFGEQLKGGLQLHDSARRLPQYSQKTMGLGSMVSKLFR